MRYSKSVLNVLTVVLILSFTFTTVGAQAELPQTEDVLPPEAEDITIDLVSDPYPIAPTGDNPVLTRTPKFYFSQAAGATMYQIQVFDFWNASALVYTFTDTGTCTGVYCWLQPTTKLKVFDTTLDRGFYTWKVRAYINGWKNWSAEKFFTVYSAGFNSTFDLNTKKWQQVSGTWVRVDKGYFKTSGILEKVASIAQQEFFFDDYVYEVRMKSKNIAANHFIVFEGIPGMLDSSNSWENGYYFQYFNDGSWMLSKLVNDAYTLLSSGMSKFINPYGWNTLTVWIDSPKIHMWVNGAYLGVVNDSSRYEGWVGVGILQSAGETAAFKVDYARLYYSGVSPYAIPDESLGEPLIMPLDGEGE